jgi:hypothetical protein
MWLSAAEKSNVSGCQMTQRYCRAFYEVVAFVEGLKHQIFHFFVIKKNGYFTKISMKLNNLIEFLC